MRVAINGFGRIGRMVFRAAYANPSIEIVAVNDLTDTSTLAHLLKYDSVHGKFKGTVSHDEQHVIVDGTSMRVYAEKDPEQLPWKKLNVDVVLECTGFFLTKELASKHIKAGAKKVLLSAPAKEEGIKTIVKGVNEHTLTKEDLIVSNASCTTNCFAPIVKVLNDNYEINKGFMVTTHGYTADQRIVDAPHKDLRRARHAALNTVPTSSGAAKAVARVIPEVGHKLHASAIRVPIPDGSMIYFVCQTKKSPTADEVNNLFANVAGHHLKEVIEYTQDPIVSSDIIGNPHSAIVDAQLTEVEEDMLKIVAWYDNEWGYSNRMIDLLLLMGNVN